MVAKKQTSSGRPDDDRDAEARALWSSDTFQRLLGEARGSDRVNDVSPEELARELAPIAADERTLADDYLRALDRLEAAQDREVTDVQGHLLNVALLAVRHLRGERSLAGWSAHTGIPEDEINAVAVALQTAARVPIAAASIGAG